LEKQFGVLTCEQGVPGGRKKGGTLFLLGGGWESLSYEEISGGKD